jgi:uncharacterized membrane protein YeaQ/YmgE (transglycosylase-associated protein family)
MGAAPHSLHRAIDGDWGQWRGGNVQDRPPRFVRSPRVTSRGRSTAVALAASQHQEDAVIGFVIAGLLIGGLARLIKPGKRHLSIWATLILGLAGSVVGGTVTTLLGTGSIGEPNVLGSIVAVVAAVALIGVAEGLIPGGPTRSRPLLETRHDRASVSAVAAHRSEEIR